MKLSSNNLITECEVKMSSNDNKSFSDEFLAQLETMDLESAKLRINELILMHLNRW